MSRINLLCITPLFLLTCSRLQPDARGIYVQKDLDVSVLAQNLHVPWGMDLLPTGKILYNERNGKTHMLDMESKEDILLSERSVNDQAEGGLLGLAVDPAFDSTHYVFLYETTRDGNQVVRMQLIGKRLVEDKIILINIPKAKYHDGGILRFGPDGYLYIGTGDARDPTSAQDKNSLAGKILRVDRDGLPAKGNPFENAVYSYGHRNVQGLAWDNNGQMFATEHGPSGEWKGWCCHDELNKIIRGGNYGWPLVIGDSTAENCLSPIAHSGEDTWAPGGLVFVKEGGPEGTEGKLLVCCLRGRKMLVFTGDQPQAEKVLFDKTYKRLRNVIQLSDGSLLFGSSNMDGREAIPQQDDDKLYQWQ